MAYSTLAHAYQQVTVLTKKLNVDVKKAQGTGTYKGSTITAENKDGEAETIKIAQVYLDNHHQKELKAAVEAIKPGDEITVLKVKTTKLTEEAYNALDDDTKKTSANWGVKAILQGHVIPDECSKKGSAPAAKAAGGSGNAYPKKDMTGVFVGHSLNGAFSYLGGAKVIADYIAAGKEIHDITTKVKTWYAEQNPKMSDYDVGAASGNAVLNALNIARDRKKGLDVVEDYAKKILSQVVPALFEYIKAPKTKEAAVQADDFADDIEQAEAEVVAPKPKATPKPKAKPAPVVEPEPEVEDEGSDDPF